MLVLTVLLQPSNNFQPSVTHQLPNVNQTHFYISNFQNPPTPANLWRTHPLTYIKWVDGGGELARLC